VERFGRWLLAAVTTVAVFVLITWACGALVLPLLLDDPAVRWGIASALGAAVAAVAASWGASVATRTPQQDPAPDPAEAPVRAEGPRSVAVGGGNSGVIATGDGPRPTPPPERAPAAPAPPSAHTVSASGERSIALGGDNTGTVSTGDQPNGTPR
jgi:hypothetical protein